MKKIAIVWTFAVCAVALAAQQPSPAAKPKPTPAQEIAKIVAVEEQERDLAKAETLYREALSGKELSAGARELAKRRLGELLQRLGRRDEAKALLATVANGDPALAGFDDFGPTPQQDIEREKALREKARELVKQVVAASGRGDATPIYGMPGPLAEQLLWIGEAAVPEVIAVLEAVPKADSFHPLVVSSLAAFLWRVGGGKAEEFLRRAKDEERLRPYVANAACAAERPEMLAVVEQYLRLPDPGLSEAMLDVYRWGRPLRARLDEGLLVDVLGQGSVAQRVWLLTWAMRPRDTHNESKPAAMPAPALAKLLPVIRAALTSAEPALGTAAQKLLVNATYLQRSAEGLELLLDWLPNPLFAGSHVNFLGESIALIPEQSRRLLPKLDACMRAVAPVRASDPRTQWLEGMAPVVVAALDASVVPQILAWVDLGYDNVVLSCRGKVNTANAAEVFARFDRVQEDWREHFLVQMFADVDLPSGMFPLLRAKADEMATKQWKGLWAFATPMARTGNPDAASWIVETWRLETERWVALETALRELGRRTQHETVRAAMRTVVGKLSGTERQSSMLLALLAMGDEPALRLVDRRQPAVVHPYATAKTAGPRRLVTPLSYLLYENPDPPHGFGVEPRIALLRAWDPPPSVSDVDPWTSDQFADDMVAALAGVVFGGMSHGDAKSRTWQGEVLRRLRTRGDQGPLRDWVERALAGRGTLAHGVLEELNATEVARWSALIEPLLADDDLAFAAADALLRAQRPLDVAAMLAGQSRLRWWAMDKVCAGKLFADDAALVPFLRSKEPSTRARVATTLGARVSLAAVPELIALLKDPEPDVRTAATEALGKIRFYHEQQAHWDRVLKGMDASPASAAEKLLLQGKPGAPKEQRVLAITSLGTLGVPEALPFLIDWTQDADADIAKAAKDAITQIHLNPRK